MALIMMDGFDHYSIEYRSDCKWDANSGLLNYFTGGRNGGGYKQFNGYSGFLDKAIDNKKTLICGVAIYNIGDISNNQDFMRFMEGGINQISLRHTNYASSQSRIAAYRNGTLLGDTGIAVVGINSWYYLEAKIVIDSTGGSVEVRVNGTTVLNLTEQNTQATTNAYIDNFMLVGQDSDIRYDDFYMCDDSGTVNNDFLGDVRVVTVYPDSDGTYNDFTPSTGTDHTTLVGDKSSFDSNYNEGDTVNQKETYNFNAGVPMVPIYGVQFTSVVNNEGAGNRKLKNMAHIDGEDYILTKEISLNDTIILHSDPLDTLPSDASNWSVLKINNIEFGVKITE